MLKSNVLFQDDVSQWFSYSYKKKGPNRFKPINCELGLFKKCNLNKLGISGPKTVPWRIDKLYAKWFPFTCLIHLKFSFWLGNYETLLKSFQIFQSWSMV